MPELDRPQANLSHASIRCVSAIPDTLVVGWGSIGQRHGRLLVEMGAGVSVVTSRPQASQLTAYGSIKEALESAEFGYCVVASPTARRRSDIDLLAKNGFSGKLLIEKPVFANSPLAMTWSRWPPPKSTTTSGSAQPLAGCEDGWGPPRH